MRDDAAVAVSLRPGDPGGIELLGEVRPGEILGELPQHMDRVQKVTREASEAIRGRFFPTQAEPSWIGEIS